MARTETPAIKAASRQRTKPLVLPAVLDMRNAQDLRDSLMAALEQGPVLRLNGSKIQQVFTPGVQVLLAASKTALAEGGQLLLANPSPALQTAFCDLGLSDQLNAWGAVDA